ncbi:MAG: hypothetical protein RIS35_1553 [Pseudomonadota bacterium]
MTTESIRLRATPAVRYVLRLGDTCLIHAQRLSEWCGHAPVLEEDIALTNLSLDLLGQARALLSLAGSMDGNAFDEDQLAFLRDERDYFNLTLAEQPSRRHSAHSPGGDFADTQVRNLMLATWLGLHWDHLRDSANPELAGIAAKAAKEAAYHVEHASQWVIRLGDGTEVSRARTLAALDAAWPYSGEMFAEDAVDTHAQAQRLGPSRASLRADWHARIGACLSEAGIALPEGSTWESRGTQGEHSEHMGFLLAEMQSLQRAFPGGRW